MLLFRKEQDKRLATQSSAGLMSAADKKKLDNFQADSIFSSKKILSFAAIREYSSWKELTYQKIMVTSRLTGMR